MFTVEVRTSQPWQVAKKLLQADAWSTVSGKKHSSQKDAEVEVAWLTNEFEDYAHLFKDFKVDYRILENGKLFWSKEEHYNPETKSA